MIFFMPWIANQVCEKYPDVNQRKSSLDPRKIPYVILKGQALLHLMEMRGFIGSLQVSGGYIGGVTPVPIPNTEVKPSRADGTAWLAMWESRSLPGFI